MMKALNLPAFDCKVKEQNGKTYIFDLVRKKYLVLTPEEWVRQHFVHFLSLNDYPISLMSIEAGLKYNRLQKRSDVVVYDRVGKPFLLIECKAPHVKLNNQTFTQVANYNQIIQAPYIAITNGLQHFFCQIDFQNKKYHFLEHLPQYS